MICSIKVTLYNQDGDHFNIEIEVQQNTIDQVLDYAAHIIARARERGWLTHPHPIEEGVETATAVAVVRRRWEGRDGEWRNVVDFYVLTYSGESVLRYPWVKLYINNEEDIAAFEKLTGVQYARMPEYTSTGALEYDRQHPKIVHLPNHVKVRRRKVGETWRLVLGHLAADGDDPVEGGSIGPDSLIGNTSEDEARLWITTTTGADWDRVLQACKVKSWKELQLRRPDKTLDNIVSVVMQ
jgi:hypothetical protein